MPTTPTTRMRCSRARASPRCAAAASSCASTTAIPDAAVAAAPPAGYDVLDPAADKPHGLREAYILDADGYVWVSDTPRGVSATCDPRAAAATI